MPDVTATDIPWRIAALAADPWRVVEAQHQISTRKLVDSDREQAIIEDLLDASKPPAPEAGRLHYLLFTPFRYPPLSHGSRFGARRERGIWYGSETIGCAFAEVAYYRFVFREGTSADLGTMETDLTAFQAAVSAAHGVDLTGARFDRWQGALASKTSYAVTQPLGRAMRDGGVEAFRYRSARDRDGGANIGVFAPAAFAARRPRALQTWYCASNQDVVEFARLDYFTNERYSYPRRQFLVRGALPQPALGR